MRPLNLLLLALALLSGCEAINDTLVRETHKDWGINRRARSQIWKGLERRKEAPPQRGPTEPAPPFMDQG